MASGAVIEHLSNESEFDATNEFPTKTATPMVIILAIYLLTILKLGPSFMKSRPAFQLKSYIVVYNILQVLSCVYLVHRILFSKLPTLVFWKCPDIPRGTAEDKDFLHVSYFAFWLKVSELSETLVFVLRKKQRQVSFLHVFHHCATLFLVFQLPRSYRGGAALYPLFLNCNVHIIMYSYYLMAAILPDYIVAKLTPIKKSITTIQMIQFALILLQVAITLSRGCKIPPTMTSVYSLIIIAFFYMFYDFYRNNYSMKKSKE
ncbi:elongation of very long chain fatty acids protein 1-like [Eupeodes corollae]|uniref:elongation of very long chain fatty acids protein 1-like n=1 Tax=Eupeodes corollae TaxID=290404 RepID=UPI002492BB73|nr:elongation of very long chain fatty acids protein 1-like [Eupeodes corollae]